MSEGLTVETLTETAQLSALAPEWAELWRISETATPFQSPAWLIPWWQTFRPGSLRVVTVRAGGSLVGIAPIYLETGGMGRRLLPLGISISDCLDVVLDPAFSDSAARAMAAHLASDRTWQSMEWPELGNDAAALSLPCPTGCEERIERSAVCPFLTLPADVETLDEILPARKRRKLRMAANRAARRGTVRFLSLADRSAAEMLDDLFRLHALRWQARGESGVLADDSVRLFHRRSTPRSAKLGVLRCYALQIGTDIAAVYYGFLQRRRAYAYLTGFDPQFEFESPGTLLLSHAIREAVREGARIFDCLRGGEAYKYEWGARDRWNYRKLLQRITADADAV